MNELLQSMLPLAIAIVGTVVTNIFLRAPRRADAAGSIAEAARSLVGPLQEQNDELRRNNEYLRSRLNAMERRVMRLERQIEGLGHHPVNGGE